MLLSLEIYTPSKYIFESRMYKYSELNHNRGDSLTQKGREEGIRRLMSINLLKRLESSVYSFNLTLGRIRKLIEDTIEAIDRYERMGNSDFPMFELADDSEMDMDEQNTDFLLL